MDKTSRLSKLVEELNDLLKKFFVEKGIVNVVHETWRQDVPSVIATWQSADGIQRNICLLVFDGYFVIEINAWKENNDLAIRRWMNKEVGRILSFSRNLEEGVVKFILIITSGYESVRDVREADLTQTTTVIPRQISVS